MSFATPEVPRILIVDDEGPARSRLRDLLDDCRESFPLAIVDEARTGREALAVLEREKVDIVLLDIRMPEMDGMEAARHIAGMAQPPAIIFTTAYDSYAIKAFEVNAIDYLLKPVRRERLLAALGKVRSGAAGHAQALAAASDHPRRHLSIHERGKIHLVPIAEILYLRAELKYVTVRTAEREFLVEESLQHLEEEFDPAFVRIHRNCLVAREAIGGFERSSEDGESGWVVVIRATGEKLPVSRRQQHVSSSSNSQRQELGVWSFDSGPGARKRGVPRGRLPENRSGPNTGSIDFAGPLRKAAIPGS